MWDLQNIAFQSLSVVFKQAPLCRGFNIACQKRASILSFNPKDT